MKGCCMKGCQTNETGDSEPFVTSGIKSLPGIKGTLENNLQEDIDTVQKNLVYATVYFCAYFAFTTNIPRSVHISNIPWYIS